MADTSHNSTDRRALSAFIPLGGVDNLPEQNYQSFARSDFFVEFDKDEIAAVARYMQVYQADKGTTVIQEGDAGDYMLLIIHGRIEVFKRDFTGLQQSMASAGPGMAVGEMSMIDGEARFATCIAMEATTFAVLTRDHIIELILDRPALGAKVLIKLITLLSQRLRHTSAKLLEFLGEQRIEI